MRCIAVFAAGLVCLAFASCGWIEESREAARHDATGLEALQAAERGDLETLKALLARNPQAANGKRWTPGTRKSSMRALTDTALTAAVRARNLEAVDLLLAAGADPNFLLDSGEVPLDVLAAADPRDATALALAKALVVRGARLAPRTWERTGETTSPLHTLVAAGAVRNGEDGLLRLFASERTALGATNLRGLTPLHIAAMGCQDRTAEVLLEAGADPLARTVSSRDAWHSQRKGDTPLHSAAECGRIDVVFALCAGGANPRLTNEAGETPLAAYRRIAGSDPSRTATAADPRKYESIVAALARDGRGVAQDRARALALFEKACGKKYEKGCEGARALR